MRSLAVVLPFLLMVAAPTIPPRPTDRVQSCTTSECHTAERSDPYVHGPATAGACTMCHVWLDEAKHSFELKHDGARLCGFCHLGEVVTAARYLHEPVEQGKCLECHDPHGSAVPFLLRAESDRDLCLECHAETFDGPYAHAADAQRACSGCHQPHASMLPNLLRAQGRMLCVGCHPDAGASSGVNFQDAVKDVACGECMACHVHHTSTVPGLLTLPASELCASCHEDVTRLAAAALVKHTPVTDDRGCLNCHEPHAAAADHLLAGSQLDVCLECHDRATHRPDGSTVASVAELAAPGLLRHDDGPCSGCHDVHGAANRSLLKLPLMRGFYATPDPAGYALCFSCHDPQSITAATTTLTRFRNGDRNLHYVHVVKPGGGGHNCRVCHTTHTSERAKQMRGTVEFGRWRIPIHFEQTPGGGRCAAGCHRARRYDRDDPVVDTTVPQ